MVTGPSPSPGTVAAPPAPSATVAAFGAVVVVAALVVGFLNPYHRITIGDVASAAALDSATLTVTLLKGIELAGFPGQREIAWQTSLVEGKNLLPLELVALTPAGGEVLARLEHENRNRTFRLRVDVS